MPLFWNYFFKYRRCFWKNKLLPRVSINDLFLFSKGVESEETTLNKTAEQRTSEDVFSMMDGVLSCMISLHKFNCFFKANPLEYFAITVVKY